MQTQTRVRKMKRAGRHHGRSTDGIRQVYYDPAIRAARGVVRVTASRSSRPEPSS